MKGLTNKQRRLRKIRGRIRGGEHQPRLAVFRSNRHVYAQVIDDQKGVTLAAASEVDIAKTSKPMTKLDKAAEVGKTLAQRVMAKKIKRVVFDRRVYKFHGRVKAVAQAMREAGVQF